MNVERSRNAADNSPPCRTPPHNFAAEMALLGAILSDNRALDKLTLIPDHFADPANGRIFEVASSMISKGQTVDPITLKDYFEQDGALNDFGGTEYLAALVRASLTAINIEDYANIIKDRHTRKRLILAAEDISERAYSFEETAQAQINTAQDQLTNLIEAGETESFTASLNKTIGEIEAAQERGGALAGITTGFTKLDSMLSGLQKGHYVIVGGRPSIGKSTLLANIALHNIAHDRRVAFFSLEMSSQEINLLMLARRSGISIKAMLGGQMGSGEISMVREAKESLMGFPLFLDDNPSLTVGEISARALKSKADLVIIDHLDLAETGEKYTSDYARVSAISKALKQIAKRLAVPVLVSHQLSRSVEYRTSKRPGLSDLRDSGKIEADADVILFLFRREYYLKREEPPPNSPDHEEWESKYREAQGRAEVIIAKQRLGPTGTVNLAFDGEVARFDNLAE